MTITALELHQLYLAYFGRPGDVEGMAYYTANPAFDVWSVCTGFSNSPESQALYGPVFGAEQVNLIYLNLFNRPAEPDGIAYWTGRVRDGHLTPAGAAYGILVGAQNEDAICVANKLAVAQAFFAALDQEFERVGYAGDNAAAEARAFLATVDRTEGSLHNGLFDMDGTVLDVITPDVVEPPPPPPPPVTPPPVTPPPVTPPPVTPPPVTPPPVTPPPVTPPPVTPPPVTPPPPSVPVSNFTASVADIVVGDAGDNFFTGTTGLTKGAAPTVHAGETVDGGDGVDRLALIFRGTTANNVPAIQVRNVETVVLTNISSGQQTVDAQHYDAADDSVATAIYSSGSTAALKVQNLRNAQVVGTMNDTAATAAALEFVYASDATQAHLEIGGTSADSVRIGGAGITATELEFILAAGKSAHLTELRLTGSTPAAVALITSGDSVAIDNFVVNSPMISAVTITGTAGALRIGTASNVRTLDASGFGGQVELFAAGFGAAAHRSQFTGGAGNDTYHARALFSDGFAHAGDGSDTLVVHGNHINATTGKNYTGFESLLVENGTVDVRHLPAGIDTIVLSPSSASTGVIGMDAEMAQQLKLNSSFAGTLTLGLANSGGGADQVALDIDAEGSHASLGRIVMSNVETLQLDTVDDLTLTDMSGFSGLRTLRLTGTQDAQIESGAIELTQSLKFALNGWTGAIHLDLSDIVFRDVETQFATSINGTPGAGTYIGSEFRDAFILGSGNDTVIHWGGADTVEMGDGGDSFSFNGMNGSGGNAEGLVVYFAFGENDSEFGTAAQNNLAFNAATAFDADRTDVISGINSKAGYTPTAGTSFEIDDRVNAEVDATSCLVTSVLTLGQTFIGAGNWVVYNNHGVEQNTAFAMRDSDLNGFINPGDLLVKLVGDAPFTQSDFTVHENGQLVFKS